MLLSALARFSEPTSRSAVSFLKSAGSALMPPPVVRAAITAGLICGDPIKPVALVGIVGDGPGDPMNPVGRAGGGVAAPGIGGEPMNVLRETPLKAGFGCPIPMENASSLTSSS